MSDFWGSMPPPNNQQPWGQQPPPQSPTQQPWGQQSMPNQQSWGQSQSQPPTQPPWGQQPTNNGWQQPLPGQFQQPPQSPKKKKNRLWLVLGIVSGVLILSCVLCGVISSLPKTSTSNSATSDQSTPVDTSTKVAQVAQSTTVPIATPTLKPTPKPKPTATPIPTDTPIPTETSSQTETDYKTSTTDTTVANLDKDGSADQGKDVHFTCTILKFVKDSSGNTAGANVTTQDTSASVQVAFTSGTDITKLNEGDTLEVWGTDEGVFSGTNAFGGTVQEVGITAQYMLDQTTNYQVDN